TVAINNLNAEGMNGFVTPSTEPVLPGKTIKSSLPGIFPDIEEGLEVINCVYYLPAKTKHVTKLLAGVKFPPKLLTETDLDAIVTAPRFGKPRGKQRLDSMLNKDTHFNYNRSWGWGGQGFAEGRYKALNNDYKSSHGSGGSSSKRYATNQDYQPTRSEYEAMNISSRRANDDNRRDNWRINDDNRRDNWRTNDDNRRDNWRANVNNQRASSSAGSSISETDTRVRDRTPTNFDSHIPSANPDHSFRTRQHDLHLNSRMSDFIPFEPFPATGNQFFLEGKGAKCFVLFCFFKKKIEYLDQMKIQNR
ncbi:hypothetical protein RFI_30341, partial [Reticulomyxa filosa]